MVEIKIWDKKEKEKDKVYLDLKKSKTGGVWLIVRDNNGNNLGNILEITKKGKLFRCFDCEVPGIQTDHVGRIRA